MSPRSAIGELPPESFREARLHLELTQRELGTLLGVSNVEIYRKESGDRPISRQQVWALVGILHEASERDYATRLAKLAGCGKFLTRRGASTNS